MISLNQTITRLHLNGNSTPSVSTKKEKLECKELILALPYKTCAALFQEHPALHQIHQKLNHLQSSPVTTVYLKYAEKVSIPQRFIGVYDGYFNWFFDRRYCNQKNLIAGTSFISPEIFATEGTTPAEKCQQELSRIFPKWPKPVDSITISEPDAKLCCSVSSNVYRPGYHTGLPNCYLAGDYTDTGLPGTIESAVKSGIKCAEQIIQSRKK